jgi:hypothetical protein
MEVSRKEEEEEEEKKKKKWRHSLVSCFPYDIVIPITYVWSRFRTSVAAVLGSPLLCLVLLVTWLFSKPFSH